MGNVAIRVEGLGKQYRIGAKQAAYKTFRETIVDTVGGPFKRVVNMARGQALSASNLTESFWALKDVSFEVTHGEVIGVIGSNGAGKSTLLKILSRIAEPTEGSIDIYGRVGSLLEVGTGFHPELTGRENIFLNGAILGMRRTEIESKFEQIVEFAEVDKFIDTPAKHYSSGMYMRLAFSVAAHLEPEILVVDEVLAVGDTRFQKKCLEKMGDVASEGRTVFFVSHNLGAIVQLCQKAIVLNNGKIVAFTAAAQATQQYLKLVNQGNQTALNARSFQGPLAASVHLNELVINDSLLSDNVVVAPNETIRLRVKGECTTEVPAFRTTFSVYHEQTRLLTLHDVPEPQLLPKGPFTAEVEIPAYLLRPGEYSIALGGYRDGFTDWMYGTNLATFHINEEWDTDYERVNYGVINLPYKGGRVSQPDPALAEN